MDTLAGLLRDQHGELAEILADLAPAGWSVATRCPGWDVLDVVLHLAQTDELAVGALEHRFDDVLAALADGLSAAPSVDEGAAGLVARDREQVTDPVAVADRWRRAAHRLDQAVVAADPHLRVQWVAGELSARTLANTRLAEAWIHTGDVAEALGIPRSPTSRLQPIARLAWRTLPYAFASAGRTLAGPVAFHLTGPAGEQWDLDPDEPALTTISGSAEDLCDVAARRRDPADTRLRGEGPDAAAVLELVRTYA